MDLIGEQPLNPPLLSLPIGLPTGVYWVLRSYLIYLCSEQRTIETLMEELNLHYRKCMPPTHLQLIVQRKVKGGPPGTLRWARLGKLKPTLDDFQSQVVPVKRKRWWRWLKIKTRMQLNSHIHFSGLDSLRKTVFGFHDRAQSLNAAHRILARRLPYVIRTFRSGLSAIGEWSSFERGATAGDPAKPFLLGSGPQLLDLAWHTEGILTRTQEALNRLLRLSPPEEIQLFSLPDFRTIPHRWVWNEGDIRWFWRAGAQGRGTHLLQHLLLRKLDERVQEKLVSEVEGIRILRLEKTLDHLLGTVRRVVRFFQELQRTSLHAREGSAPLEDFPYRRLVDDLGHFPLPRLTNAGPP